MMNRVCRDMDNEKLDEVTARKIIEGIDHFLLNNKEQASRVLVDALETTMISKNNYIFNEILKYGKNKLKDETENFLYEHIEYLINNHLN